MGKWILLGRLHLEVEEGAEVIMVPAGEFLFTADAAGLLAITAQQVQA